MKRILDRKLVFCLAVALATIAAAPVALTQQNPSLDKHARKIEKKLTRYPKGYYVQVDLRDGSASLGALGALSGSSFQMTDADNNRTVTFAYRDVSEVHKGEQYIGEGSEPGHRPHLLLPVLIGAAAAATAIALVETLR